MRIIKVKTLHDYCKLAKYRNAEKQLQAWIFDVKFTEWDSASELMLKYKNASIINSKRVVFNIKGNEYRLVVDIEFKLKIVFIVWFGTHTEYDKIDVKEVSYET